MLTKIPTVVERCPHCAYTARAVRAQQALSSLAAHLVLFHNSAPEAALQRELLAAGVDMIVNHATFVGVAE